MTQEEKQMEFAVFCIENVAHELKEQPEDTYRTLKESGVLEELIFDCYDVLHTQSKEHIVEDIITALNNRKEERSKE